MQAQDYPWQMLQLTLPLLALRTPRSPRVQVITPGTYTVTVTDVSAAGYTWNGTKPSISFTLQ